MARKPNKRKLAQAEKLAAQPKPKRVGIIAHTPHGGSSVALALAVAQAFPEMVSVDFLDSDKEGVL